MDNLNNTGFDMSANLFERMARPLTNNVEVLRDRMFKAENTIMYLSGVTSNHERRIKRLEGQND